MLITTTETLHGKNYVEIGIVMGKNIYSTFDFTKKGLPFHKAKGGYCKGLKTNDDIQKEYLNIDDSVLKKDLYSLSDDEKKNRHDFETVNDYFYEITQTMISEAKNAGADAVIGVKYETRILDELQIHLMVYGTAVRYIG